MFRLALAALLLIASPVVAASQPAPSPDQAVRQASASAPTPQGFKWWQSDRFKAELGLSNDQSLKLEAIFQGAIPRLRATFEDVDRLEKQMSKLISASDTTEVDVVRQLNQVQAARNEADRQRTLMLFRMQRELTPEQRTKFKAMRDRWEQERREGRRQEPPEPRQGQMRK
jgi:Spy/CpxP family protein refolding chaperone